MATSRFRRISRKPPTKVASLQELNVLDYSKGFNSYLANDVLPPDVLRFSQDARISTLGRMITRLGADYYSDAAGETQDDVQTSVTGASDQTIGTSLYKAMKFTTTSGGRLTKVELNLKSNTGTAPIIVEIYSNSGGAPGTLLATSSIQSNELTGSYAYITARFVDAPLLVTTTDYWIVAYIQEEGSGTYYWSSTTNATTALSSTNKTTWSATSYDLNMKTHLSTDGGVKGLFRAYNSDGTKKTLMAHGTVLYSISDVNGSLTSVKTGLNSSATKYRFANINNEVFYVNGYDAPRKWDFTTDAAMGGSPQVASLIKAHQDYLFLNDVTDPTKIVFTDEDDYEAFTSTSFIYVPSPKSPEPIVGMESLNGVLHIFTTGSKHSLYGVDKSTFQLVEAAAKKGTFTQETIAATRGYIYFLADDGVYRFNGAEDELISAGISDKIESMTNKDSAILAVDKNRLKIFYRSSGSGYNDKCLVYNIDYEAWESEDTNQYVNRAIMYTGGSDDFEFVTASSLVGQAFYFGQSGNDYNDLGKPLDFDVRTGYLHANNPNAEKRWKRWYPRLKKQSRSYSIEAQVDTNFADSPTSYLVDVGATGATWGSGLTWGGGSVYGSSQFESDRIHLAGESYYLQLRIRKQGSNTPAEFLGHTLTFHEKRRR